MLIGRHIEIKRLDKAFYSKEAEFIVLYGRRRVGKTFLIREYFKEKNCIFLQSNGLQKGSLKKQLANFAQALSDTFLKGIALPTPRSFEEAFNTLTRLIEQSNPSQKCVIFLDELPWMATKRSGLLEALDYYWNRFWSANPRIILIICGSSASWLINHIIYNKGGLHNRCTGEIKLDPFNLFETKLFLQNRGIRLNDKHILEIYMALGGIPYYLKYVEPGLSSRENIQQILFDQKAPLRDEFHKLFHSLFLNADVYIELVRLIAQKKEGVSRAELESLSKLSPGGGRLTKQLHQLIQTNFIASHIPFHKKRGEFFKIVDEFSLFYLTFLEPTKSNRYPPDYWQKQINESLYRVWTGLAFEAVCHKHIVQILKALNIKTAQNITSFRIHSPKENERGAQIDLLIERSDDAIDLIEIKYTESPFVIDKETYEKLTQKIAVFKNFTKTNKQLFITLLSANGLKKTLYSEEIVDRLVVLKDLFVS